MSEWLLSATELVTFRQPETLAANFVNTIKHQFRLKKCILLVPSQDGRLLVPCSSDLSLSWSVTDFDSPVAHVLQSAQPMILTNEQLVFWQSDWVFKQLTEAVGMFCRILLQPLPLNAGKVQSILIAIGDIPELDSIFNDELFVKYVDVFFSQWSLLNEVAKGERVKLDLSESISTYTRATEHQKKCEQLSTTLLGKSHVMKVLREQIINAASSQLSVMVQGDTGTGKELVAQAIHDFSNRANAPFIAINCAAIPDSLLESELFGYSKGAFSGANSDKQGLISQANGGTLFLDEIGDMPLGLQAKLLRVLESKAFRPLGSKKEQLSDFRLISATHVNLIEQVKVKEFRQDLYYRLYQYPLALPTLTQRAEDIELLSQHFIQSYNERNHTQVRGIHYQAMDCLKAHSFPGNVRELKHLIELGCAQTNDNTQIEASCFALQIAHFENIVTPQESSYVGSDTTVMENIICEANDMSMESAAHEKNTTEITASIKDGFCEVDDLKQAMHDYEYQIIYSRLNYYSGDRSKAAKSLGIPKRTLAHKCKKLEIETS